AGVAITPVPLPEAIRHGLDSPYPSIRLGAVAALGEWLTDPDPGRTLTAHTTLQHVADTDAPTVATAARALLGAAPPRQTTETAHAPRPPTPRPDAPQRDAPPSRDTRPVPTATALGQPATEGDPAATVATQAEAAVANAAPIQPQAEFDAVPAADE